MGWIREKRKESSEGDPCGIMDTHEPAMAEECISLQFCLSVQFGLVYTDECK